MSYDLNIDEARARNWVADVENEISIVKDLLTKVSTASTTTPAEEDDIMKGIEQTCVTMRNFWDKMCSGFSGLIDNLKQAIEKMANSTNEVVGDVNEVRNKVGS